MDPEDQKDGAGVDWNACTWEGARRAHLKAFRRLSFREKIQTLEEWCEFSRSIIKRRQQRGQPIIPLHRDDPATKAGI